MLNGEAGELIFGNAVTSAADWALLWFTGAYGGVRIFSQVVCARETSGPHIASGCLLTCVPAFDALARARGQFALLKHTSATTLALSNVAIQALTTILGIFLFGTQVTAFLLAGVSVTLTATAAYTYVKVTKILEPPKEDKTKTLI